MRCGFVSRGTAFYRVMCTVGRTPEELTKGGDGSPMRLLAGPLELHEAGGRNFRGKDAT